MREKMLNQLNNLNSIVLFILVFFTPLLFLSKTTEYFETPKLILLGLGVLALLLIRGLIWVSEGKVSITRTPIDLPLLLLAAVLILSTLFSPVRDISLLGSLPRIHGSTISWVIYILFFFLLTFSLRGINQVRTLLLCLIGSATLVAILTFLSYFGVYLPFDFTKLANFTPTGSSFSTAALLILLLPLLLSSIVETLKVVSPVVATVLATFYLAVIALIGDPIIYVATLIALILFYVTHKAAVNSKLRSSQFLTALFIPVIVAVVVLILSNFPASSRNPLYRKYSSFPHEVQLPFGESWVVSASAFRDSPFLGTGPSTYLYDFTLYKDLSYNMTKFWDIRFDTSFNEYFQVFATLGIFGLLALVFLSVVILNFGWRGLKSDNSLVAALSVSSLLIVVLLLLHVSTLVLVIAAFIIIASLMALSRSTDKVEELSIGIKASKITDSNLVTGDALPLILLIPIIVIILYTLFTGSKIVLADYHHRLALNAASTQGLTTYNELVMAENLNPSVDLYRTDLAQTNFALANSIAQAKGPSQASPSGSLTDADKQNIQTLLSQAINGGRAAVTLNPLSAQNWEILASIYRQISGVAQNALQFSLASYGQAIQRDPLNPLLRLSIGGVYYSVKNYDLAVRFFTDAVNLKPDFANGYYNLAVALRDQGNLQSAIAAAQQVVALVDPKSQDYQTASTLLSDLENQAKQASSSAQTAQQPTQTPPPAAQSTSALQNQQLPQVLNLPQPGNVATPSAVKK